MDQQGGTAPPPPPGQQPPPPPPAQQWQSTPQQPGPPPPAAGQPAGGTPAWMGNLTSQAAIPGPAGLFYADVPNRVIAMLIDVIGVVIVQFVLVAIATAIFGVPTIFGAIANPTALLIGNVLAFIVWGAYFIYTWVTMRGTLGMRVLGLQVGHESDGRSLTYQQAAIRFGVLFGPQIVIGLLGSIIPSLNALGLLSFVWLIVILVTMAQSPTKQGLHDKYAQSMVVKGGRSVA